MVVPFEKEVLPLFTIIAKDIYPKKCELDLNNVTFQFVRFPWWTSNTLSRRDYKNPLIVEKNYQERFGRKRKVHSSNLSTDCLKHTSAESQCEETQQDIDNRAEKARKSSSQRNRYCYPENTIRKRWHGLQTPGNDRQAGKGSL